VSCTVDQYEQGRHYRAAEACADTHGYTDVAQVIDENDPAWMFFRSDITWEDEAAIAITP
jgi:hypothetical protein